MDIEKNEESDKLVINEVSTLSKAQQFLHKYMKLISILGVVIALLIIFLTESEGLFVLIILINILCITIYIIQMYTSPQFSNIINKMCMMTVLLCSLSVLAVIPLDITETIWYADQSDSIENVKRFSRHQERFLNAYEGIYIVSSVFSLLFFNLLMIANLNGYLSLAKIVRHTCKTFLLNTFKAILAGLFIMILVTTLLEIEGSILMNTLLIISNSIGIAWLVLLLGIGLVQFPLEYLLAHHTETNMDNLLEHSDGLFRGYRGLQMELKSSVCDFSRVLGKIEEDRDEYVYVEYLREELPKYESVLGTAGNDLESVVKSKVNYSDHSMVDEELIAAARANLKAIHEKLTIAYALWQYNFKQVKQQSNLQDIDFPSQNVYFRKERRIPPKVIPFQTKMINIILGSFFFLLSLIVLFQQLFLAFGGGSSVLLFSQIKEAMGGKPSCVVLMITLVLAIQGYIVVVANFALHKKSSFKLDLGNTSMNSMLRYCQKSFSLAFPLAYMTLMLFDETKEKEIHIQYRSGFSVFYNPITKIPLIGPYYNQMVPILIVIVMVSQVLFKVREYRRQGKDGEEIKRLARIKEGERVVIQELKKEDRYIKAQQIITDRQQMKKEEEEEVGYIQDVDIELQLQQNLINQQGQDQNPQEMFGMLVEEGGTCKVKQRYFQVEKEYLVSYQDGQSVKALSQLSFADIYQVSEKKDAIEIEDHLGKRVTLRAADEEKAQDWVRYLQYKLTLFQLEDI